MKATFELPEALLREIKLRAVRDGKKLKELVEDLLRKGLSASLAPGEQRKSRIGKDPRTGLPIILGGKRAKAGDEITPDRIKEILLQQEVEWHLEAGR